MTAVNVYLSIYDLIVQYIYGGAELDTFQQLVTTEISTILSMIVACAPVIIILMLTRYCFTLMKR